MNTLLLKKFTPEILRGAKSLGFETEVNAGILSVEKAEAIEELSGQTIGQLALLGIESSAPPEQQNSRRTLVLETIDLMKAFDAQPKSPRIIDSPRQALTNHASK